MSDGSNATVSSDRPPHDGGPRRQGRPGGDRGAVRSTILRAAMHLFAAVPFPDVSMDDVAREADLPVRSVTHEFPSKRVLYQAVVGDAIDRFTVEIAERVLVHAEVRRRLNALIDVYENFYRNDPEVLTFFAAAIVDGHVEQRRPVRPGADELAEGDSGVPLQEDINRVAAGIDVFIGLMVDNAVERGELHDGANRDALAKLLRMLSMGLALSATEPRGDFLGVLEELRYLVDGTIFKT